MVKHVAIKLTILLLLLLLLAMAAPVVLAQSGAGTAIPKNVPQVTVPAPPDVGPTSGKISHQFKIRPKPGKSDQVDLGKVIMEPTNPYTVYKDPQFHLNWFRMDHPALALDFKIKGK